VSDVTKTQLCSYHRPVAYLGKQAANIFRIIRNFWKLKHVVLVPIKSTAIHRINHTSSSVNLSQFTLTGVSVSKDNTPTVCNKITVLLITFCTGKNGPGWLSRYSDSLRAGRSGDRIPVGVKFFTPAQTSPGAHPASYTMGTGSFPGVKRSGRGVDHPLPSRAEVNERVPLLHIWAFVT
jgi:hypothetical protein